MLPFSSRPLPTSEETFCSHSYLSLESIFNNLKSYYLLSNVLPSPVHSALHKLRVVDSHSDGFALPSWKNRTLTLKLLLLIFANICLGRYHQLLLRPRKKHWDHYFAAERMQHNKERLPGLRNSSRIVAFWKNPSLPKGLKGPQLRQR